MDEIIVKECKKYMDEHCMSGKITLKKFAKDLFYNPSYLSRRYKKATGRNLMDDFRDRQMKVATLISI